MLQEERMDPPPDFGYDDYKGTGKLKGKVGPQQHITLYEL